MQAWEEEHMLEVPGRTLAPCDPHGYSPSNALRDPRNHRATSAETRHAHIR